MAINENIDFEQISKYYHQSLHEDVIPFWMEHSIDEKYGGYFTSLDREGRVFDTDKFIWLQSRQIWTFAKFYNVIRQEPQWLDVAIQGAEFLKWNGRDEKGNWYFSLDREGNPLIQPYNIFSDCFAAMAFAQLYKATGNVEYRVIARKTFENILARQDKPKGNYSKAFPGTRSLWGFALPMILSNLTLELEGVIDETLVELTIERVIHIIMEVFYRPEYGTILENVNNDGTFSDTYDGRLMNPGHVLEAMWFIMDLGIRHNDEDMIARAVEISLTTLEKGWDEKYGGLYYFLDVKGNPPLQLEWDQKLWWVHLEAMVATIKGYSLTGNEKMADWFIQLHKFTTSKFPDPEYGEWYGYLNRRGETLLSLKGGKWKGCFHVPRGMHQIGTILNSIYDCD